MVKKITLSFLGTMLSILMVSAQDPTTVATPPDKDAVNVISVYSDAYDVNIATNLNPDWGQATVSTEIEVNGDNILKYSGLNFQGMDYTETDVSAMEYVHMDYYTNDATTLSFFLIGTGENAYDIGAIDGITTGSWVSLDIPLTHYTEPDLTAVYQFKTVGDGTVYLDNLYFWKEPTASGTDVTLSDLTIDGVTPENFAPAKSTYDEDMVAGTSNVPVVAVETTDPAASVVVTAAGSIPGTTTVEVTSADESASVTYYVNFTATIPPEAAPVPDKDEANVISVYSDSYTSIATNLNPYWNQTTQWSEFDFDGNKAMRYGDLNYQGLEYTSTDVSAMGFVHLDYFTVDATNLDFSLIGEGEYPYDVDATDGITLGSWVSLDIPLSHYTSVNLANVSQFKTDGNGTVYLDNLYFWKFGTAVREHMQQGFSFYPNPAGSHMNLSSESMIEQVQVLDLSGKVIREITVNQRIVLLNLETLEAGFYLLRVNMEGRIETTPFIRE